MSMSMPAHVIKNVDCIRLREKQGREFRFLGRSKEPYEWTDTFPEDDPKFQGLLEEEEAPFPKISAKIPGIPFEDDKDKFQVVTNKPEPAFEDLAAAAL